MKKIEYFVMDVDGTLTNGNIYISAQGECFKAFNVKDGYGIHNVLKSLGVHSVIITGRVSKIVERRCEELEIAEVHQGIENKLNTLKSITADLSSVVYVGDDLNDLECMNEVKLAGGIVCCPADAVKQVLDVADYISTVNGGNGAVRDIIDWLKDNYFTER